MFYKHFLHDIVCGPSPVALFFIVNIQINVSLFFISLELRKKDRIKITHIQMEEIFTLLLSVIIT